jgi:hypothetical protein
MATTRISQLVPTHIPSDFRMVSMLDAAYFEDLPPYTPGSARDADTMSIHSTAPSYRSEPPEYNDVEPLRRSLYYQETSFFDDSQDDIVMTEVEVEVEQTQDTVEEEEEYEPLTPTQSRMDTAPLQQQSSLLFPDVPLTPTVTRRPVPVSPQQQSFSLLDVGSQEAADELPELSREESPQEFEPRGLPRMSWAPGFRPLDAFSAANYSFVSVASIQRNLPVRQQLENVARRRVLRDAEGVIVSSLLSGSSPLIEMPSNEVPELTRDEGSPQNSRETTPTPQSPRTPTSTSQHAAMADAIRRRAVPTPSSPTTASPLRPQEDPELVGEAAAKRARQQREYREMLSNDRERALKLESAGWDFMLAQSRDWEERQSSWAAFRQSRMRKAERRAVNGRGIGFQGFSGGLSRILSRG